MARRRLFLCAEEAEDAAENSDLISSDADATIAEDDDDDAESISSGGSSKSILTEVGMAEAAEVSLLCICRRSSEVRDSGASKELEEEEVD